MPIKINDIDQYTGEVVAKLMHSSFDALSGFLNTLSSSSRLNFETLLLTDALVAALGSRKNKLAEIVLKQSGVAYLAEDRLRTVFLLAKLSGSNYKSATQSFKSEFGDSFQLRENYQVKTSLRSWKEIALKAREIANGYHNYDLLQARETVDMVLDFFSSYHENDPKKIVATIELTGDLLAFFEQREMNPGSDNELIEIRSKLEQLARLCGWLDMEVEKIKDERDFYKYNDFVEQVRFVAMAKLYLVNRKLPVDNPEPARKELLKYFALEVAFLYRGDSMARQHVKLPQK